MKTRTRFFPGQWSPFLRMLGTLAAISCPPLAQSETAVEAWAQRYSYVVDSQDQANKVVADSGGNVIVAGTTENGVTGEDMLIIKYSSAGMALWTNRYNGPGNGADVPTALAVDGSGDVLMTGYSFGDGGANAYTTIKYSSAGAPLWTNRYNGPGGDDSAYAMALDTSGNVLVTGSSYDGVSGYDYATIKYSSAGAPLWTNRYNGPGGDDSATAIALDTTGNVYVTGSSVGIGTDTDYATVAYSSAGLPLWTNRYNGPGNGADDPTALAVDASGNVFVTGNSDSGTSPDYATIAYSSAGATLWVNRYDGPGNGYDEAYAIAVAGTNVFVTGFSDGGVSGGDYTTIAYSSAGAALWTNRYNGPGNGEDRAFAMAVTGTSVYVTGYSYGGGVSGYDYATIKYSSAGVALWTNRYTGPGIGADAGQAVAVDGSGNVLVTGAADSGTSPDWTTIAYSSAGTVLWLNRYNGLSQSSGSPQAVAVDASGNIVVTGTSLGNGTGYDYATIKYSSTGAALWTNRYSGPGNYEDKANAVAVDANGNVIVTGYSEDSVSYDYVTVEYSSAGATLWVNRYNGPGNYADIARAVAVDASGNVFVTGSSYGSIGLEYATIGYSSAGAPLWTNRYSGPGNNAVAYAVAVAGTNVFVTGVSLRSGSDSEYATIAYSTAGTPLWTNLYSGPGNSDSGALALAVDASGNVVVTGYSQNSLNDYDYATIKYSSAGVPLWTNRYSGPGNGYDQASAVAVDASGNVVVTGFSQVSLNANDYATVKYSSAGVPLWTNRYHGPINGSDDSAQAVAVDASGRVFVTGYSYSGTTADFATIAYSSEGVGLWTNRYSGPGDNEDRPLTSRSIAAVGDGSVVVVGSSFFGGHIDYATVEYVTVPQLSIALTSSSTAKVSWPFPSTGFNLQQNSNLNTTNWVSPSESVANNGAIRFIIVNPPTGNRFYRLVRP